MKLRDRVYWQNHYNDVPDHVGKCIGCPEARNIEAMPGLSAVYDLAKRLTLEACSYSATDSIARYKTKDYADHMFESLVGKQAKIQRQIGYFGAGDGEFVRNLVHKEKLSSGVSLNFRQMVGDYQLISPFSYRAGSALIEPARNRNRRLRTGQQKVCSPMVVYQCTHQLHSQL